MEKYHENKTPRDGEYVAAYLKHNSQIKAAKECGVGRETIARAVRRAGISLRGQHNSTNSGGGDPPKITDAQLIEEARTMNCREIALKHHMSEERVWRRAKRLGIDLNTKGCGGHWKRRSDYYGCGSFDDSITIKALYQRDGGVCQICGKPTDWTDIRKGHIGKMYPTLDHIQALSKGGSHTWDNVQLAHMSCNAGKCDREWI